MPVRTLVMFLSPGYFLGIVRFSYSPIRNVAKSQSAALVDTFNCWQETGAKDVGTGVQWGYDPRFCEETESAEKCPFTRLMQTEC